MIKTAAQSLLTAVALLCAATPAAAQLFQDFTGWTVSGFVSQTNDNWVTRNVAHQNITHPTGSNPSASLAALTTHPVTWIKTPGLSNGVGTVSFWHRNERTSQSVLAIEWSATGNDGDWGDPLATITNSSTSWQQASKAVNVYDAGYLRLRKTSDQNDPRESLHVDDINITLPPSRVWFSDVRTEPVDPGIDMEGVVRAVARPSSLASNLALSVWHRAGIDAAVNAAEWFEIGMTNAAKNLFAATNAIPGRDARYTVQYFIRAEFDGPLNLSPSYHPAAASNAPLFYRPGEVAQDFDAWPAMTNFVDSSLGDWSLKSGRVFESDDDFGAPVSSPRALALSDNAGSYLAAPQRPHGIGAITFAARHVSEPAASAHVVLESSPTGDPGDWTVEQTWPAESGWTSISNDLALYTNAWFRLRKHDPGGDADSFMLLDDIRISLPTPRVQILNMQRIPPGVVEDNMQVEVKADLLPSSLAEISEVELRYRIGLHGAWTNIAMSLQSGSEWSTAPDAIPEQSAGYNVFYHIHVHFEGQPTSSGLATNAVAYYTVSERQFERNHSSMVITENFNNHPMLLVGDYSWEGFAMLSGVVDNPVFRFQGTRISPAGTVVWGDDAPPATTWPFAGTATENQSAIPLAGAQSNRFLFRFNDQTLDYSVIQTAFQDFSAWTGAEAFGTYTNAQWELTNGRVINDEDREWISGQPFAVLNNTGGAASIRSPEMPEGLGELSFRYRLYSTSSPPDTVVFSVQKSKTGTKDDEDWVTVTVVTNDVRVYDRFRLTLNDRYYNYWRIVNSADEGHDALCIDEIVAAWPGAGAIMSGLEIDPAEPTVISPVEVSLDIEPRLGASILAVTNWYRYGPDGEWHGLEMTNAAGRYAAVEPVPRPPVGVTQVYYYVETFYEGYQDEYGSPLFYPENGAADPDVYTLLPALTFSNRAIDPPAPTVLDEVMVAVDIEPLPVAAAAVSNLAPVLWYRFAGSDTNFSSIAMEFTGGSTYETEPPGIPRGPQTDVQYYIAAHYLSGGEWYTENHPFAAPAAVFEYTNSYIRRNQDFDNWPGAPFQYPTNMTHEGWTIRNVWVPAVHAPDSGPYSAGLEALVTVPETYVQSPMMSNGVGTVSFQYRNQATRAQVFELQKSYTGEPDDWWPVQAFTNSSTSWQSKKVNIDSTSNMFLRISKITDTNNENDLLFIDDIVVSYPPARVAVSDVMTHPGYVSATNDVHVSAVITNVLPSFPAHQIAAQLYYRVKPSGTWIGPLQMNRESGTDAFRTAPGNPIPAAAFEAGDTVEYYIRVTFGGHAHPGESRSPTTWPEGGPGAWNAVVPFTPATFTVRRFASSYDGFTIAVSNAPSFDMRQFGHNEWQGIVNVGQPGAYLEIRLDGNAFYNGTNYLHTAVPWGDGEQWNFEVPTEGFVQPGTNLTIRLDNPEPGQQYLVRFNEETGEYMIVAAAFEDFDHWDTGTELFTTGAKGIGSEVFSPDFAPLTRSFRSQFQNFGGDDWSSAFGYQTHYDWAMMGRVTGTNPRFETPPDRVATDDMGWVRQVYAVLDQGVGDVKFNYRAVDTNMHLVLYEHPNVQTWTNVSIEAQLDATTIGGDDFNGLQADHRIIVRYQDENNYYFARIYNHSTTYLRIQFHHLHNGTLHTLRTSNAFVGNLNQGGTFRFIVRNDPNVSNRVYMEVFYNGISRMTHNHQDNRAIRTPGKIGFASREADMIVKNVTVSVAPLSATQTFVGWETDGFENTERNGWQATQASINGARARLERGVSASVTSPDLGFEYGVGTVRVNYKSGMATNTPAAKMKIQTSNNGSVWVDYIEVTGISDHVNYTDTTWTINRSAARYVRVLCSSGGSEGRLDVERIVITEQVVTHYENNFSAQADDWTDAGGVWTLNAGAGTYSRPAYGVEPAAFMVALVNSNAFQVHGVNLGYPGHTNEWDIAAHVTGVDNIQYVNNYTLNIRTNAAKYVLIRQTAGDAMLRFDDIYLTNWRGEDFDVDGWKVSQGWIEDWFQSRVLEFRNSRAQPWSAQHIRSPLTIHGAGRIEFDYRNAVNGQAVSWRLERATAANPDNWTELLAVTNVTPNAWTPVSHTVNSVNPVYLRVVHTTDPGVDATLLLKNLRVIPYTEGRVDENWTAYNAAMADDSTWSADLLFRGIGRSAQLNNHISNDTVGGPYAAEAPYLQTPLLEDGIGEIGFWYRSWNGNVNLAVQKSPTGTNQWNTITNLTVNNSLFIPFRVELHDLTNHFVRIVNDTGTSTARLAIDEFYVTRPMGANLVMTNAATYPQVPLLSDEVHLEVTLTRFFRAPFVTSVQAFWKSGVDDWGTWGDANAMSMSLVASNVTHRPFSFTYRTDNAISSHAIDDTVQYRFRARFEGPFSHITSPKDYRGFENPAWYEPTDHNETYGASDNRIPYYIVFSCPPGAVWVNEVNVVDNYDYTQEFIELTGPAGVNIGDWVVENYDQNGTFVTSYTVTNNFTISNAVNGFGFWLLADDTIPGRHQTLTNEYWVYDENHLALGGGVVLRRSMGAWEYRLSYGLSDPKLPGFEYIGVDFWHLSGSLQLQGEEAGSSYEDFEWEHTDPATPGAVNVNQTLLGDTDSPPFVVTSSVEDLRNRTATLKANLVSTGGSDADVRIYWGPTDGGEYPAAWTNVIMLGTQSVAKTFSAPITGLSPATPYYYRAYATNATAERWATKGQSFVTYADLAVNNAAGADAVTRDSALLRGELASDAGEPAGVYLYWGETDGVENPGAWSNSQQVGTRSAGAFELGVHDLRPNTTYRYRAYVTNSTGSAWSPVAAAFTTKAVRYVTADGDGDGEDGYTSWEGASSNLAAVVAAAADGDLVLVSNGVFNADGSYPLDSFLALTNAVTVRSVNGAAVTIINAGTVPNLRGVWMGHADAVLEGFTVRGGSRTANGTTPEAGGGIYFDPAGGRVYNLFVTDNSAGNGGGIYLAAAAQNAHALRNILVADNHALENGGGLWMAGAAAVENLTVADNTAASRGGGLYAADGSAELINTIVYYNQAVTEGSNWYHAAAQPAYGYVLTAPAVTGAEILTAPPRFFNRGGGDYRLAEGSPALDSGLNLAWMNGAADLAGNDRILNGKVDRGAYEGVNYLPNAINNERGATDVLGSSARLHGDLTGTGGQITEVYIYWGETDGEDDLEAWEEEPIWLGERTAGEFDYLLSGLTAQRTYYYRAYATNAAGQDYWAPASAVFSTLGVYYVATNGLHVFPFASWANAATNIQSAIDAAPEDGVVEIDDGVYTVGSEIVVSNGVTVRGRNGAAHTHVSGGGNTRVFRLAHSNAVIEGLTIRDGYVLGAGGGVFIDPDGSGGTVRNCVIRDNQSAWGDVAAECGGGVYLAGKANGTWLVQNCLIISNYSEFMGGGIRMENHGRAENNTIVENTSYYGGGVYSESGGTVVFENNIIFNNHADWSYQEGDEDYLFWGNPTLLYNASPGLSGNGNISEAPSFVNPAAADYRLLSGWNGSRTWLGIDGGINRDWMIDAFDLAGNPRIQAATVDIGAYEGALLDVASYPGATNETAATAVLRVSVIGVIGGIDEVRVYYGTTDGGTNVAGPGSWNGVYATPTNATLGLGEIWAPVTGLDPDTAYFYRAWASNSERSVWATESAAFTTERPTEIVNNDPQPLTTNSVLLKGTLATVDGDDPVVRIYWGISNGGTNQAAWTTHTNLGVKAEGGFSATVSGLESGRQYFFRANASNATGEVWAPDTRDFYARVALEVVSSRGHADPPVGLHVYDWNTFVTASITNPVVEPGDGTRYEAVSWIGTGSVPEPEMDTTTSFYLTNNSTITWSWVTRYRLELTADGGGGFDTASGWYAPGTPLIIEAQPDANHYFTGWSGQTNGATFEGFNNEIIRFNDFDAPRAVTGSFVSVRHTFTIYSPYGESDPVSGTTVTNDYGTWLSATVSGSPVEPAEGTQYVAVGWTRTGSVSNAPAPALPDPGYVTQNTNTSFALTADSSLNWTWKTNVQLSASVIGNGSLNLGTNWVAYGSNVTLVATPDPNNNFTGWSGQTNDCLIDGDTIVIPMHAPRAITAAFELAETAKGTPISWYEDKEMDPEDYGLEADDWDGMDDVDSDGDGMLNWEEYLAGTDPLDPKSVFRILRVTILPGGVPHVEWLGGKQGPVRPYIVQRSYDLDNTESWHDLDMDSQNQDEEHYDWTGEADAGANAFYRVVVSPADE